MYLTFVELDDFLKHLTDRDYKTLHAEITAKTSDPGQFGVYSITYYAALTCRFEDHSFQEYIATTSEMLTQANSLAMQHEPDRESMREKMFARFNKLLQDLSDRGFKVERGQWTIEAPHFLGGKT